MFSVWNKFCFVSQRNVILKSITHFPNVRVYPFLFYMIELFAIFRGNFEMGAIVLFNLDKYSKDQDESFCFDVDIVLLRRNLRAFQNIIAKISFVSLRFLHQIGYFDFDYPLYRNQLYFWYWMKQPIVFEALAHSSSRNREMFSVSVATKIVNFFAQLTRVVQKGFFQKSERNFSKTI